MDKDKKYFVVVTFLVFVGFGISPLFSQSENRVKDFYSPYLMSGTASVADQMAPESDAVNPASSALAQRITLDLNYSGIIGTGDSNKGYLGHAFNLGGTIPTKIGVFSLSGHLFSSDDYSFRAPLYFGLNGSFSKELYPDLLTGMGLKAAVNTELQSAAALDLGVIYFPGKLWFLEDTAVGVALQDFGWTNMTSGYQLPYTVTAGIKGTVLTSDDFNIDLKSDISVPGFRSLMYSVGLTINYKDFVSLNLGSRADLNAILNGNAWGLIPSVGLNFHFKTSLDKKNDFLGLSKKGWNESDINIQTGFAPLASDLWTFGTGVNIPLGVIDTSPPDIEIDLSGLEAQSMNTNDNNSAVFIKGRKKTSGKFSRTKRYLVDSSKTRSTKTIDKSQDKLFPGIPILTYISPNNDGVKDKLTIPLSIKDSRYIKGFSFLVTDENGKIIREIKNKERRIENQGVKGFFERLFEVKKGIDIPKEIIWDGLNDSGSVVPDGLYYFHIEAWDDNGNVGKTKAYAFIVDNTPPEIDITPPSEDDKIFSPNGDGSKDTIVFDQKGSVEDKWEGEILDSEGKTVKKYLWEDEAPGNVIWDGKDSSGALVSDGVYSYTITSTDRAGNSVRSGFGNIIKNTEVTPVSLVIDKQFFSPNNDKILDDLVFTPVVPVKTGITGWKLEIVDESGKTRKSFKDFTTVPGTIIFDGRDSAGIILEEGRYHAKLKVMYKNGNNPEAVSPVFTVDVTKPSAVVRLNTKVFSPNGDGQKDIIKIFQETSLEKSWTAFIKTPDGKVVKSYQWVGTADPQIVWNGIDENGRLSEDGVYTYSLSSVDRAGNLGESNSVAFTLDTEKTAVILTPEYTEFSPNGDGEKDYIKIFPQVTVKEGISSYKLTIFDSTKKSVKIFEGRNYLPEYFLWDGNNDENVKVPDGTYNAHLGIVYEKGDKPEAVSAGFVVDTKYPEIVLSTDYLLFSPDGDGKKDVLKIEQHSDEAILWKGEIKNSLGEVVKTIFWKDGITNFSWDGTDSAGNKVQDGSYIYTVSGSDSAGNYTEKEVKGIMVDTSVTKVFITASAPYISPTGNGKYEDLVFKPIVTNKNGIKEWHLKLIYKENAVVEKDFSGTTRIPKEIIWDGGNKNGVFYEGRYYAVFSVVYEKGNEPVAKTSDFILDVSPPAIGLTLSPLPFSPDNDGVNDELDLNIAAKDLSGINDWKIEIFDPENRPFMKFEGKGAPSDKITWNGKSSHGELVYAAMDYPVIMTVSDILGNVAITRSKIPIDVLVVRDGENLKIKIASIIFKKNSAELVDDNPETVKTNEFVLERISQILKKYKSYQIVIEGHAVVTKWYDEAAAKLEDEKELKPLSLARARTVRDDLIARGLSPSRLRAVGAGGKNPLVPNSDLENRWKNRRVEFILIKK